jgi:hypothetical protein
MRGKLLAEMVIACRQEKFRHIVVVILGAVSVALIPA